VINTRQVLMDRFRPLKLLINKIGSLYVSMLCKREYAAQRFIEINERPIELAFLFRQLTRIWPKTVLDVGTGITALPHLMRNSGFVVTAIDNIKDYWPYGMVNRHYYVINDDITAPRLQQKFDFISCISVIEHIVDHESAIKSMFSLLNPGGSMVLTFPYNERRYVGNVYTLPDSEVDDLPPFITQAFSRHELDRWLHENNGTLIEQEYWQFFTGEYWTVGKLVTPPEQVTVNELHQVTCVLIRKN
jgi:SAM-dependent methyltransferase